jgi:hypothetical protein
MLRDPLTRGYVTAQVGEALANYALADIPLQHKFDQPPPDRQPFLQLYDDSEFWRTIFQYDAEEATIGNSFDCGIFHAGVSEWVARVPGLYWRPGSGNMRSVNPAEIESETRRWKTYKPQGKSRLVSGGIGTLKLPANEDGFRLVTLTTSFNASTGVPALVAPDVWEHHGLCEGRIILNGTAKWREMPHKWAVQFPSVRGVPRACLLLTKVDHISVNDTEAPILIHPFTVMEYWTDTAQLHDFVYATADTSNAGFRRELSTFFEAYRTAHGRDGSYLVAADISCPMWDAVFANPEDMRMRKASQLRLLEARIRATANGDDVVDALVRKLSQVDGVDVLVRLSTDAGIEPRRWLAGGLIAEEAARLVDAAIRADKQLTLLQLVLLEFAR